MLFTGEFLTPCPPDQVYDFLSDPDRFLRLLPDFQNLTVHDPAHFTLWLKVGLGNMRGTAEIKMELTDVVPRTQVAYKGEGRAMGSQLDFSFRFQLAPLPESTRVSWQSSVGISGGIAVMAGGMLEPLARSNTQKLMDGLQKALCETTVTLPAAAAAAPDAQPAPAGPLPPVSDNPVPAADASVQSSAPANDSPRPDQGNLQE